MKAEEVNSLIGMKFPKRKEEKMKPKGKPAPAPKGKPPKKGGSKTNFGKEKC